MKQIQPRLTTPGASMALAYSPQLSRVGTTVLYTSRHELRRETAPRRISVQDRK